MLIKESGDELDDEVLLGAREGSCLLEDALETPDGARTARSRRLCIDKEIVDSDAKSLGHLGEHFATRRLLSPFPESDVALVDSEKSRELDLGEASSRPESEQMGSLSRPSTASAKFVAPSM